MKLPIIRALGDFIETHDEDFVLETIEVLEHLSQVESLKDSEMDVLGEILSNLYGAIEVNKDVIQGVERREALNNFMTRVLGSIDR